MKTHWGWPLLIVACAGCAGLTPKFSSKPSATAEITPRRAERREEAVKAFEHQRNRAQFAAAVARWKQGDTAGAESILQPLIDRDPTQADARRLLADLYLDSDNHAAAEKQLRALLEHHPDDAPAHHSLALLLETTGRETDATKHFRRAQELEPTNPLFTIDGASAKLAERAGQPSRITRPAASGHSFETRRPTVNEEFVAPKVHIDEPLTNRRATTHLSDE